MKAFFFRKGHIFIGVYSLDNMSHVLGESRAGQYRIDCYFGTFR